MDITYLGHSSFKIKTKSASLITDPFDSKMVGLKFSPIDAEIVTVSHSHDDHNASEKITSVKKVIDGPGEYEISGISIEGFRTFHDDKGGTERGKNTIYVYEAEGLRVAHLGDLGHMLDEELVNDLGDIDVLMVPVGGYYTIGPKEASEVVNKINPYFVLPMHYKVEGLSEPLSENLLEVNDFLKESGLSVENMPKFTIKREDILEDQNTKVVILERK